jgi:hypothetical protein
MDHFADLWHTINELDVEFVVIRSLKQTREILQADDLGAQLKYHIFLFLTVV